MLLAEHILLLDRKLDGTPLTELARPMAELNRWMAAACVAELAAMGRLQLVGNEVLATSDVAAHYMLLNDVLMVVKKKPLAPMATVDAVARAMPRIAADLLSSMVLRGILIEEKTARFGLAMFGKVRYPVQSTSAYKESLRFINDGIESLGLADLWSLSLILLADGMSLVQAILPDLAPVLDGRLDRFEAFVSGTRAPPDINAQRARIIFALTRYE
jgi:Golgi phosphoprotein 3 (GPP34)